jgi:hypothetical protein
MASNLIGLEFFSTTSNTTLRIIDCYVQDSTTFWLCQDIKTNDSNFFIIHNDEVVAELEDIEE